MMDQAQKLREKVSQINNSPPNNTRVIAITSGKGGVGKTSLSVNLAIQLQQQGKRVIIIDADFGLANVEVMLGIRPTYNLSDLIYNNKSVEDIITEGPEGVGFISGGSGVQDLVNLDKSNIKILISKLAKLDTLYDVVIIDTGAGIADSVLEFVVSSPEVIVIVTPEPTSITDAYSLLKAVNRKKEFKTSNKSIKVISNRVSDEAEGMEIYNKLSIVVSKFLNINLEYLGYILHGKEASKAVIEQKPITMSYPNSGVTKCFINISEKLVNGDCKIIESENGIAKVFLDFIKTKRKRG